jgi:hypothetical protein
MKVNEDANRLKIYLPNIVNVRISLPDPSLFSLSQDDVVWAIITLTPRPPSQHNSLPVDSVSLLYKGIR